MFDRARRMLLAVVVGSSSDEPEQLLQSPPMRPSPVAVGENDNNNHDDETTRLVGSATVTPPTTPTAVPQQQRNRPNQDLARQRDQVGISGEVQGGHDNSSTSSPYNYYGSTANNAPATSSRSPATGVPSSTGNASRTTTRISNNNNNSVDPEDDDTSREEDDGSTDSENREDDEEGEAARHAINDDDDDEQQQHDEMIAVLTRRLRCLFAVITWPIVPIGTLVALALVWVLYAAVVLEFQQSCAHPLHWYAVMSLLLVSYIPYHARIRQFLFNYVRERDGYHRPIAVRRYDQCFHTLALLYVYGGITLVQTCRDDMQVLLLEDQSTSSTSVNACVATCPHLFQAITVYVTTVELFTFSLILPLLFLPCIYLWFLRQATADAEALAFLQERLREEEFLFRNGGVTVQEVLAQLDPVHLVSCSTNEGDGEEGTILRVVILPLGNHDISQGIDAGGVKSCCICMNDFRIDSVPDIETPLLPPNDVVDDSTSANEAVVRTKQCGHLFHRHCIASWVGGRWQPSSTSNDTDRDHSTDESGSSSPRRRARRTTCPLCRNDLRPA